MSKRALVSTTVRRFAQRSTAASARLEYREIPAGFVRSSKVEKFLESKRPTR